MLDIVVLLTHHVYVTLHVGRLCAVLLCWASHATCSLGRQQQVSTFLSENSSICLPEDHEQSILPCWLTLAD